MESLESLESKGLRIKSVVYPETKPTFNDWASQLNVSCMYEEPRKETGYKYSYPQKRVERNFIQNFFYYLDLWK